jgi:Icc-related predicted phosphoesterase
MENRRTTRFLCLHDVAGDAGAVTQALDECQGQGRSIDAIAVIGDLAGPGAPRTGYRAVFHALGESGLPAYWVPGQADAPVVGYLREAYNVEIVFPLLHGVHGTAAFTPDGHLVVAGMGGLLDDDPDANRDEVAELRYPRWEPEYRLKVLRELGEHQLMMLSWTAPAHKGHGGAGSEALAELVNTFRPRLLVCGGPPLAEMLGKCLVLSPGALSDGSYAIADLHAREVEHATLGAAVR